MLIEPLPLRLQLVERHVVLLPGRSTSPGLHPPLTPPNPGTAADRSNLPCFTFKPTAYPETLGKRAHPVLP